MSPSPQDVLDMVTRTAAGSVGAGDEIGSIEPGKRADLTLIDLATPAMRPAINPVSNIVHYGHPGIVHSVLCDGAWLMRDRHLTTIDEPDLLPARRGRDSARVGAHARREPRPGQDPSMTYSLAGRCARTGMLGAVITTSSIAVGSRCVHARAGLGVVLTQHRTDPRLGPRGLQLLEGGCTPAGVVAALVASTPDAGWRQLAVLDRHGARARISPARTSSRRRAWQAGRIASPPATSCAIPGCRRRWWPRSSEAAELGLPERLLMALEAGDRAGGETRAVRSAALLVMHEQSFPYVDLRVDASDAPIAALRALWVEYAPEADAFVERAISPRQ